MEKIKRRRPWKVGGARSGRRAVAMQGGSLPPSLFIGMDGAILLVFVVFEFVDHSVHVRK